MAGFSIGGSLGFGKSNNRSTVLINKQTKSRFDPLFNQASGILAQPFKSYTEPMTAGLTDLQKQGAQVAQSGVGAWKGILGQAAQGATAASTYTPTHVTAGQIAGTDLSAYTNPYEDQVVGNVMADLERGRQQAITAGQAAANQAHAFGGSRHGVADSLTNAEAFRNEGSVAAQLRQAGYDRATQLAGQDIDRRFAADSGNQAADQSAASLRYQGAGLLGQVAAQGQQQNAADASLLNQFGAQEQATNQAALDAQYQEFLRTQDPERRLTLLNNLMGAIGNLYAGANGKGAQTQVNAGISAGYGG